MRGSCLRLAGDSEHTSVSLKKVTLADSTTPDNPKRHARRRRCDLDQCLVAPLALGLFIPPLKSAMPLQSLRPAACASSSARNHPSVSLPLPLAQLILPRTSRPPMGEEASTIPLISTRNPPPPPLPCLGLQPLATMDTTGRDASPSERHACKQTRLSQSKMYSHLAAAFSALLPPLPLPV